MVETTLEIILIIVVVLMGIMIISMAVITYRGYKENEVLKKELKRELLTGRHFLE